MLGFVRQAAASGCKITKFGQSCIALHRFALKSIRFPVWPDCWIIFKYVAIYNNENLPSQSKIEILPITILTLKKLPNTFKLISMWQNFAISGHTVDFPSDSR